MWFNTVDFNKNNNLVFIAEEKETNKDSSISVWIGVVWV